LPSNNELDILISNLGVPNNLANFGDGFYWQSQEKG
jgi:hypothetical protein